MGAAESGAEGPYGGFRVFKVNAGSPACDANLEVFFDVITEINGIKIGSSQSTFTKAIQEAENKQVRMTVLNIRSRTFRDVYVTPRKWHGGGLLGAIVRYDVVDTEHNQGIRIQEVFPNSPAQAAGLVAYKDYILGTEEIMFRDIAELSVLVDQSLGKRVLIYVYNSEMEAIRKVTLEPRLDWGGEGAIGADIRSGMLHRIPAPRRPLGVAEEVKQSLGQELLSEPEQLPGGQPPVGASATEPVHAAPQAAQPVPLDPAAELAMLQQRLATLQGAALRPVTAAAAPIAHAVQHALPVAAAAHYAPAAPAASTAPYPSAASSAPAASAVQTSPLAHAAPQAPAALAAPAALETVPLSATEELAMLQRKLAALQASASGSTPAAPASHVHAELSNQPAAHVTAQLQPPATLTASPPAPQPVAFTPETPVKAAVARFHGPSAQTSAAVPATAQAAAPAAAPATPLQPPAVSPVASQAQPPAALTTAALQTPGCEETSMTPGANLRVPPTTPAHGLEAVQMDPGVALQSPSIVNISNVPGFMLGGDAHLEADDDEALVPGVIFEVPWLPVVSAA